MSVGRVFGCCYRGGRGEGEGGLVMDVVKVGHVALLSEGGSPMSVVCIN